MSIQPVVFSPYRIMWLFVMFDLPVGSKKERKEATMFRNSLLDMGFEMSQFSVYLKYVVSKEKAETLGEQISRFLPAGGKVDILTITDKQFANIKQYIGKSRAKNRGKPSQLQLF